MLTKILLTFLLLNLLNNGFAEQVRVQTKFGELRGFLSKPYNGDEKAEIFLNVPYALPPTGSLRFEKPEYYNFTWPTGRDALDFGPGCLPMLNEFDVPVAEDCLSLNIFRPHKNVKSDKALPVLVYGFSSLGPDKDYSSNLGLFDQAMAFRWIFENVASFGGDPKRITAQGLSAGAGSIDYISQTVEMSGSANSEWACNKETIDYTHKFGQFVGCSTDDGKVFKECLRGKTSDELLKATSEFISPTPKFLQFTPVYDADFFPKPLEQLLVEAPKIPNLIGVTALESHYFIVMNKDMPINSMAVPPEKQASYGKTNLEEYVHNFTHWFGHIFENKKPLVQHELLKFYTRDPPASDKFFYLRRFNELTSDFFFTIPALRMAQARSAAGWPTYFYLNSYFNPDQFPKGTPCQGATHANEYPYMNGLFAVSEFEFNKKDREFQKLLNNILVDFTKNGKPAKNWPPVTWNSIPHGHLTNKLEIINQAPFKEAFEFWAELGTRLAQDIIGGLPKIQSEKIEL